MLAFAVRRIGHPECWRIALSCRPFFTHVRPETPSDCLATTRRATASATACRRHARSDRRGHGGAARRPRAAAGDWHRPLTRPESSVPLYPFSCIDLALSVKRQVIAVSGHQDMGQQSWTGNTAVDRTLWFPGLRQRVALCTAEFRPHMPNDAKARRNEFDLLGDVFTDHLCTPGVELQQFAQHHAEDSLVRRAANDDGGVIAADFDLAIINSGGQLACTDCGAAWLCTT